MPSSPSEHLRRLSLTLGASMVAGALAGAIAGWSVVPVVMEPSVQPIVPETPVTPATSTPSVPNTDVTVIPVDRRPQASLLPAPFASRRQSSVASMYRRGGSSGGLLTEDRLLGQAVAVTSDGWFVAPSTVGSGLRLTDIVFWHDGHAATATRAVADHASGVTFFKVPFTNLDAASFARVSDVSRGLAVWVERRANRFEPSGVEALSQFLETLDGRSSEMILRRGIVVGMMSAGDEGAPVWSANGALVGLAIGAMGESISYIPASAWSASLSSLLSQGEIRHASLGVHSVELAWARLDGTVRVSAERGAWLRADAKRKEPAVEKGSPAAIGGLKDGDVITQVDRDILDGSADLGELLVDYRPGTSVTLTVRRGAQLLDIPVQLGTVVTSEELN